MNLEDLKLIQKDLHEAYEMNDKTLIGHALDRLDILIIEETQQLQEGHVSKVVGTEIKPANTVQVIKILASEINEWCIDDCINSPSPHEPDGYIKIGSEACYKCRYNQNKEEHANNYIISCSKYTEEQAKKQRLWIIT